MIKRIIIKNLKIITLCLIISAFVFSQNIYGYSAITKTKVTPKHKTVIKKTKVVKKSSIPAKKAAVIKKSPVPAKKAAIVKKPPVAVKKDPVATKTSVPEVKEITINNYDDLFNAITSMTKDKMVFTDPKIEKALNKAKDLLGNITTGDMSDFEKEKAIHDYIINNVKIHASDNTSVMTAYDVLVENNGDDSGYAEATKLLLNLSGIDCIIVDGQFDNGTNVIKHEWNMIKLSGKYYHLDVFLDNNSYLDESTSPENRITYNYFNVCDDSLLNHLWDKTKYSQSSNSGTDNVITMLNDMIEKPNLYLIKGNYIYYVDSTDGSLSRCNFDGSESIKISSDTAPVTSLNIIGDTLVYSSDYIYKMQLDGTGKTKISDYSVEGLGVNSFDISDGFIYYLENDNPDENMYNIYKMDINTGAKTKITNDKLPIAIYFDAYKGWVYFCQLGENESGLFRINTLDNKLTKIIDDMPVGITFDGEWFYYSIITEKTIYDSSGIPAQTEDTTTPYKIKIDGTNKEQNGEPIVQYTKCNG